MSRSVKKNPFCGITTAKSEKKDKQRINRSIRRRFNKDDVLSENYVHPEKNDVMTKWCMAKDGKQRLVTDASIKKYTRK